jgi:GNAT superfamily N-acetyltransferase
MIRNVRRLALGGRSPPVQIASIADHPDLVDTIARWHWDAWGHLDPRGSLDAWAGSLRQRTNRDRIPTLYVALRGAELLGVAGLTEHDLPTRPELSPWLSGVYVKPEARGRGIASALVRHAARQAARMGAPRLYLHTFDARGLYEKLGWRVIDEDTYLGGRIAIMMIEPRADASLIGKAGPARSLAQRLRSLHARRRPDRT